MGLPMSGLFIVFEGGEGSGKSSVSKFVVESLHERGIPAIRTREPGGSPYAEKIRELILDEMGRHADARTMFGLFWAGRRDHMRHTIIPALERGTIVISDRFDASSFAYQVHGQEQHELEDHFWYMRRGYVEPHVPHQYLFFDIEPRVGLTRARSRAEGTTHFDERELDFHERLRHGYAKFFSTEDPHIPHTMLDASEPFEQVRQRALDLVLGMAKAQ